MWNTALLIGWDEPGGHLRPRRPRARAPAPIRAGPAGELGFTFDRSGYRVPAIIISPWVVLLPAGLDDNALAGLGGDGFGMAGW